MDRTPRRSAGRWCNLSADFDQRFYYTGNETQNVWGYRFGVLINDKYKLGLGGYYMNKTAGIADHAGLNAGSTMAVAQRQLYLGTLFYEPFLMRRRLWEASIVLEAGYGKMANRMVNTADSSKTSRQTTAVLPAGAGLSLSFKPPALQHLRFLQWIGH